MINTPTPNNRHQREGFTFVELLVVISIIAVLMSAVLVGGPALINKTKTNSTRTVLNIVDQAVDQFEREEKASPRLSRTAQGAGAGRVRYKTRYGLYPPDELEVFSTTGLPGSSPAGAPLTPNSTAGRPKVVPTPTGPDGYSEMLFYTKENPRAELEHRDVLALVLAINLYGSESRVILDGLAEANRSVGALDADGNPAIFLDRNEDDVWNTEDDEQILLITDSWGNPISYFAQRDHPTGGPSSNYANWNSVSSGLLMVNGGKPVTMSWGADGSDQLNKETITADDKAILINDFAGGDNAEFRMKNALNLDNVFSDETLKDRLIKGVPLTHGES